MTFPARRTLLLPLGVVIFAIGGCGSQSASTSSATPTPGSVLTPSVTKTQPPPATPVIKGSVAAIVNGHTIPIDTYRLFLNLAVRSSASQPGVTHKALAQQTMEEVIYNELIREYAVAHHIVVTDAEVAKQQATDQKSAGGAATFNQKLAQFGLTPTSYLALIRPNLLARKVESVIAPGKPARTDAAARALANSLLARLKKGADFAALAKKYSDDPGSGAQGGDLGQVAPGQTVAPFDKVAFHAALKQYVLVKSQFGYHIVEVLSRGKTVAPTAPKGTAPTLSAHVRHILISTQPPNPQAQRTAFIAWLKNREKASSIQRIAQVT